MCRTIFVIQKLMQADHLELLKQINQPHIIEAYQQAHPEQQAAFNVQLTKIETTYPGGLRAYHLNAIQLLKASSEGVNPYANYDIGKPQGLSFSYDDLNTWEKYETLGLQQFKDTCFMLVAGGLGQRLGYPGIKISIPTELLTEKSFLKYYCEYVLAYEQKYCEKGTIPFAIMTSEDTHEKTLELLVQNNFFGLKKDQVHLLTQEKVPALTDNDAHFQLRSDTLLLQTKPHGHGDVHTLLHMSGLAKKWLQQGKKWITVFQDTNPFALRSLPLLLGISYEKDFDFNTLGVPRKPGEAVGAITSLVHKETKQTLTINIEYNQIEAAVKDIGGQPVTADGYSQFPGNTNCFALKLSSYVQVLQKTQGLISEFINPKYADATKTKFKSAARLECMMQDYPKLLPNCDKVGFASIPKGYCFSTLKNDLLSANQKHKQGLSGEGASHCEADIYINNRHLLRLCGADIEEGKQELVGGSELPMFPLISYSPHFATCLTELKKKVKKLKVHARSSLIIDVDCVLEDVEIDGHYEIKEGGNITVKHMDKDYHSLEDLKEEDQEPHLKIRGYKLKKHHKHAK